MTHSWCWEKGKQNTCRQQAATTVCMTEKKKQNHNIYTVNKYIKHKGTLSFWTGQSGSEIKLKLHLCENKTFCVFCGDKAFSCYDGSQLSLWLRTENLTLITSDRKMTTSTAHRCYGEATLPQEGWRWTQRKNTLTDEKGRQKLAWSWETPPLVFMSLIFYKYAAFSWKIVRKQSCRYEQKMRDEQLHQFLSLHSNRSNINQPERQKYQTMFLQHYRPQSSHITRPAACSRATPGSFLDCRWEFGQDTSDWKNALDKRLNTGMRNAI